MDIAECGLEDNNGDIEDVEHARLVEYVAQGGLKDWLGCLVELKDETLKEFVLQTGILHQFMVTILQSIVKDTRLYLMKIKSYAYKVSR